MFCTTTINIVVSLTCTATILFSNFESCHVEPVILDFNKYYKSRRDISGYNNSEMSHLALLK